MSQESVELVRSLQPGPHDDLVALFRDESASAALLDRLRPHFHERVVILNPTGVADRERYVGLAGLRAGWIEWLRPWDGYRVEVEDIIDAGDDTLVLVRDYGRREGVAGEVSVAGAAVWTVRNGKVARIAFYADRAEALASRENAEIVRRLADVWNERGWRGVDEEGLLHPGVEYHDDPAWPEARSTYGTAALVERFDEVLGAIGQRAHTTVEQIVADGARVALVCRMTGEGSASGIPYAYRWGFLCRIRDGQVDYLRAYLDPAEALRAVGESAAG